MTAIRIVDVTDEPTFRLIPPCADPGFDHRSCDYWEDADRGSKAARLAWLEGSPPAGARPPGRRRQPVRRRRAASRRSTRSRRPAARARRPSTRSRTTTTTRPSRTRSRRGPPPGRRSARDAPRKLGLLGRGLAVFGSYAKVLLVDEVAVAYAQFGPLSAYPRAQRLRELYPQLPDAPLPAVITCIATTAEARGRGHAQRARRGGLRRPRGSRLRGRRGVPGASGPGRTRRARRRRRSGSNPGSRSPSTTSGSPSSVAS